MAEETSIYHQGQLLLQELTRTLKWYEKNKESQPQLIEIKKENVLRCFRMLKVLEHFSKIPSNEIIICIPSKYKKELSANIPIIEIDITDTDLISQLNSIKDDASRISSRSKISFDPGSAYYKGCELFNQQWAPSE